MVSRNPPRASTAQPPAKGAVQTPAQPAPSAGEQDGNWSQAFQDAAAEYMATLTQIGSRLQEKQQAALEQFVQACQNMAQSGTGDDLTDTYRELFAALQNQDADKMQSVQAEYSARLQQRLGEAEANTRNQAGEYSSAVQAAWQEANAQLPSAFQTYVGAVKSCFAKLPVQSADPAALAVVAQGIAAAASYAAWAAQASSAGAPQAKS